MTESRHKANTASFLSTLLVHIKKRWGKLVIFSWLYGVTALDFTKVLIWNCWLDVSKDIRPVIMLVHLSREVLFLNWLLELGSLCSANHYLISVPHFRLIQHLWPSRLFSCRPHGLEVSLFQILSRTQRAVQTFTEFFVQYLCIQHIRCFWRQLSNISLLFTGFLNWGVTG